MTVCTTSPSAHEYVQDIMLLLLLFFWGVFIFLGDLGIIYHACRVCCGCRSMGTVSREPLYFSCVVRGVVYSLVRCCRRSLTARAVPSGTGTTDCMKVAVNSRPHTPNRKAHPTLRIYDKRPRMVSCGDFKGAVTLSGHFRLHRALRLPSPS